MLYLEDYLEMIENLPMEMRDRMTEIRENDLEVQNSLDSLEEKVKTYFKKCQQNTLKEPSRSENFAKLKEAYAKALEETDDKVQIANQIYEIVERHLRKLDHELSKFKMELEADNAGITEVLEKRSLEDELTVRSSTRGEKRKAFHLSNGTNSHTKQAAIEGINAVKDVLNRDTPTSRRVASAANSPTTQMFSSTPVNPTNVATLSASSNAAILAAASQAIAATQQVQGGRRTPNVKVNVTSNTELSKDLAYARDAAFSASQFVQETTPSRSQRNKKQSAKAAALKQQQQEQQQKHQAAAAAAAAADTSSNASNETAEHTSIDANGQVVTWTYDPNEPRYCLCNDVSYGDMVGCDNPDCPMEWFHYSCVGLTQAPKGKWFCPQCTAAMKRRGRR